MLPREQAIAMLLALTSWKQIDVVLKQISNCLDSNVKVGGAVAAIQGPPKRRGKKKVDYYVFISLDYDIVF